MTAPQGSSRARSALASLAVAVTMAVAVAVVAAAPATSAQEGVHPGPVPRAGCGPGSDPETGGRQGRVTADDISSGRMTDGARCNTELVGHHGTQAGLKVARFVDAAGHECAYYDTE